MRPAGILFDCDGVLVDSEGAALDVILATAAAHGITLSRDEANRRFTGGTVQGVMDGLRGLGAVLPGNCVDLFYADLYGRLAAGTDLIDGVEALLDRLDRAGIPYAIGSNGRMAKMEVTLSQHPALKARFTGRIFSGQDLGCPKPDPALWRLCADAIGVPPAACAVVDDSPAGILGAVRAGIPAYGLAEHDDGARLKVLGAVVVHRLADLPALWGL